MSSSFVAALVLLMNASRADMYRAVGSGHACNITVAPFGG